MHCSVSVASHHITCKIRCWQIFKCVFAAISNTFKWYSSPTAIYASSFYASFSCFYCMRWHKWLTTANGTMNEQHDASVCWQLVWRHTRFGGKLCNDFQTCSQAMSKVLPAFTSFTINHCTTSAKANWWVARANKVRLIRLLKSWF